MKHWNFPKLDGVYSDHPLGYGDKDFVGGGEFRVEDEEVGREDEAAFDFSNAGHIGGVTCES